MTKFHSDDYIRFLRSIRPDNMGEYSKLLQRFNVGEDCPVFDGLYEFCQLSSGGSVASAVKLNKQVAKQREHLEYLTSETRFKVISFDYCFFLPS